jgi:U1 small nuclear ribonucleoprotein
MNQFERTPPPPVKKPLLTPSQFKRLRAEHKEKIHRERLEPLIEQYMAEKKASRGEFEGMNCYKTLFVGRLAYEVTERKLLREFETHGPIKDIRVIYVTNNNTTEEDNKTSSDKKKKISRGYAFIEYEREEDMKRAYKYADAMRIDGRAIVVDVERGHTVPNFLPRRLGGGLGATRASGKPPGIYTIHVSLFNVCPFVYFPIIYNFYFTKHSQDLSYPVDMILPQLRHVVLPLLG